MVLVVNVSMVQVNREDDEVSYTKVLNSVSTLQPADSMRSCLRIRLTHSGRSHSCERPGQHMSILIDLLIWHVFADASLT